MHLTMGLSCIKSALQKIAQSQKFYILQHKITRVKLHFEI